MKHATIIFLMCILTISAVSAAADRDYLTTGHDSGHSNTMDTFADYDVTNFLETNVTITSRINQDASIPALVGDVDGDSIQEIVYDAGDGLHVIRYNQDTQNFVEPYSVGTVRIHTAITLFDGDNDGKDEIYFCGNTTTNQNSTFFAYEVESGVISLKWSHQIADDVLAPDTNPGMGCVPQKNTGTADASATNTVYAPVCTTLQNGTNVCLFVGVCDEPECPQRFFPYLGVYRFDAENGAELKHDLINDPIAEIRDLGAVDAAIYGYGQQGEVINGDRKHIFTPVCNFDTSDDEQELIFIAVADTPGGPDYDTFMFVIDIETMTKNNNFDGDGVLTLNTDVDDFHSSPSCFDNGDGNGHQIYIAEEIAAGLVDINRIESDGTINNVETSTDSSIDRVSNLIFGEFQGDQVIDAAVLIQDSGTGDVEFFGAETDSLIPDAIWYDLGAQTDALRPCMSSTQADEAGVGPSNLAGDLEGDIAITYGLYKTDPDNEELIRVNYTYGADSVCPSLADVNSDGFTDVVLMDGVTIRILIANTTSINELPDLLYITPDVRGRTMCYGNQSYNIPPAGYTDAEANNVRIQWRCNATAGYDNTSFSAYGTDFTVSCNYNVTGSHVATLCLQDNIHPTDTTECMNIETVVSNAEGCEEPDLIFDAEDTVSDTDPDDDAVPAGALENLNNQLNNAYEFLGGRSQQSRDIISIFIIIMSILAIATSIATFGWLVGLIIGVLLMAVMSFTSTGDGGTLLSPVYLMVLIILSLVLLFVVRPLLSKGSGGGE